MKDIIRYWIRFTGFVQGVGFRYRAAHLAALLKLTGWVANEWDGSVTMEVQGFKPNIDELVEKIGEGRFIQIDGIEKKEIPVEKYETSFEARY